MINLLLPQRAATVQTLGHPAAGVIGWFESSSNASGVPVTEDTALTYSAVWCATRIISETIATLPCILYRRTTDDSRERAVDDDRYWLIHDEPHPLINAVTFFETLTAHVVLHGNCYARIVYDQTGSPVRLEPRKPETMRVELEEDGETLEYYCTDPVEERPGYEMLHVLGLGGDALHGWSVIKHAQQSIGGGMAADKQAVRQFSNGAVPNGLLVHPMRLNKEAREQLRRDWEEVHCGSDKSGKVGILHGGMDFKALSMTNEDAQFLESRQFSIREVARWFRLPPHMLADLADSSVRANIEQQAIEFVVYSLAPWLIRWQQTLNRKLLTRDERRTMYYEFLLESLLRGDIASRYNAYAIARQWGWLSVNDIRKSENMNSVDGGDVYLQPVNMAPAGTVPATITREFQSNLAESLGKILDEGKQLRQELSYGLESAQSVIAASGERIDAQLAGQRETARQIREELEKMDRAQVQGFLTERTELEQASLAMFRAELQCAVKIERAEVAKAARRQQERGESFLAWMDEWYPGYRDELPERTRNSVTCWQLVTKQMAMSRWSERWCDESIRQLMEAADGDRDGFAARVQAVLDGWDERVKRATPNIGGNDGCMEKICCD